MLSLIKKTEYTGVTVSNVKAGTRNRNCKPCEIS